MNIQHLTADDLDQRGKQLYNSCVHYATNGSIYGYDWYLNATAQDWDFLVEEDEDSWVSVMPLPKTKNWWGRQVLEQPRLLPELAVYTVRAMSTKRIQAFWDAIPAEYRKGSLVVEPASVPKTQGRFSVEAARGTVLPLDKDYEDIIGDFPPEYHEGLIRAQMANLRPASSFKPERLADFWLKVNGNTPDNMWKFHAMQRLMYQVLHRSWGGTHAVQDEAGELMAMTFIVYSHGRMFPLFTVESVAGKAVGALTYLWDNLLKTHANKSLKIKREELGY